MFCIRVMCCEQANCYLIFVNISFCHTRIVCTCRFSSACVCSATGHRVCFTNVTTYNPYRLNFYCNCCYFLGRKKLLIWLKSISKIDTTSMRLEFTMWFIFFSFNQSEIINCSVYGVFTGEKIWLIEDDDKIMNRSCTPVLRSSISSVVFVYCFSQRAFR